MVRCFTDLPSDIWRIVLTFLAVTADGAKDLRCQCQLGISKTEKMAQSLTDLPMDMLTMVLTILAVAADGAKDLALTMSTCKTLKRFTEETQLMAIVKFQNVKLNGHTRSFRFHHPRGLLSRCVQAGNESAKFILAKTILVGSFPVWERMEASIKEGILTDCVLNLSFSSNVSVGSLHHVRLVRSFLCACSGRDFHFVSFQLNKYVMYFASCDGFHALQIFDDIMEMSTLSADMERYLKEYERREDLKDYYIALKGYSESDWTRCQEDMAMFIEVMKEDFVEVRYRAIFHFDHLFRLSRPCFFCKIW